MSLQMSDVQRRRAGTGSGNGHASLPSVSPSATFAARRTHQKRQMCCEDGAEVAGSGTRLALAAITSSTLFVASFIMFGASSQTAAAASHYNDSCRQLEITIYRMRGR